MQIEKNLLYQRIFFVAFWVRGTFSFISDEIFPFLDNIQPIVFMIYDFVLCTLGILTIRKRLDIVMLLSFIAISYFSTCVYNGLSLVYYINGTRDFISFLFAIPIIRYFFGNPYRKDIFTRSFDRQLFIFLIIQFPCLMWQYLKYGAGDYGGGSLGYYYSGIISTIIYVISFYLIQKRVEPNNYFRSLWENKIYIILLIPSFFNETKISFIFLAMYFILLMPIDRKLFIRILVTIPIVTLFIYISFIAYSVSTSGRNGNPFSADYLIEYFMMDVEEAEGDALWNADYGIPDVPRMTKLLFLEVIDEENPGHKLTGFGLGQFKGRTFLKETEFYKEYDWLLEGSIPYVFHLIIQLGILGLIWFAVYWIIYLVIPPKWSSGRNWNLQLYLIITFGIILIYNDSFRNLFLFIILMYLMMMSWTYTYNQSESDAF